MIPHLRRGDKSDEAATEKTIKELRLNRSGVPRSFGCNLCAKNPNTQLFSAACRQSEPAIIGENYIRLKDLGIEPLWAADHGVQPRTINELVKPTGKNTTAITRAIADAYEAHYITRLGMGTRASAFQYIVTDSGRGIIERYAAQDQLGLLR